LTPPGGFAYAGSFSADGSTLYFRSDPYLNATITRMDMQTRKAELVLRSNFAQRDPQISPDGKWLAFTSDATGAHEVYVQNLITPDAARVRISTNGGDNPRWRRDGSELFYLSPQKAIVRVVPHAGEWNDTKTAELFRAPADALCFDVSPDGQSFLVTEGTPGAVDGFFHVILGWQ
jgi:serine/threonine-protein kinase